MFKLFAIFALISIAAAGVQCTSPPSHPPPNPEWNKNKGGSSEDAHAETIENKSDVRADGFDWSLETSNGISAQASGDEHGNMLGEFSYVSKDGVPVKVSYVADENGFQPSSDLLPTPPPTPEAILKALANLSSHVDQEESKRGKH